jgi:hypothetical protein
MEPLSVLILDEYLGTSNLDEAAELLSGPDAKIFFLTLLARLHQPEQVSNGKTNEAETNGKANGLADSTESSDDEMLIQSPRKSTPEAKATGTKNNDSTSHARTPLVILDEISDLRKSYRKRLRGVRVAFRLVHTLRRHLHNAGVLKFNSSNMKPFNRKADDSLVSLMCMCLGGRFGVKEGKQLVDGLR